MDVEKLDSNKLKIFTAFSQRLAGYLMWRGFVLIGMRKDDKGTRNLFFFRDSDSLQSSINEYLTNKNQ